MTYTWTRSPLRLGAHTFGFFYEPPDSGGSGGDVSGGSPGASGPGGNIGPQGQSAAGTPSVHTFADENAQFILPGQTAPTTVRDFLAAHRPMAEVSAAEERVRQAQAYLIREAQRIEALGRGQAQGQGQPNQGRRATDRQQGPNAQPRYQRTVDKLRGNPVVDGDSLAQLVEDVRNGDIQPIVSAIQQQAKVITQLQKRLEQQEAGMRTHNNARTRVQFDAVVDSALTKIGLDPKNQALRDYAEQVYHLYDPKSWKNFAEEFPTTLATHHKALMASIREHDQRQLEQARTNRGPIFPGRGGNANPRGPQRYQFETGQQIGRKLFNQNRAAS